MPRKLTLQEARKEFSIPVRKLALLMRAGLVSAELEGEKLLIPHSERRCTTRRSSTEPSRRF